MNSKVPYLSAAVLATASLLYLANTPGLSAAQPISVTAISGDKINLAAPQGKTRLVSFWAPDCSISDRDVPSFSKLQKQFANDDFEVVAVAMPYSTDEGIQLHKKDHNIDFPIAHDTDGNVSDSFPGVRFTPTTFLINGSGEIVWRHIGQINPTEAAVQISEVLQPQLAKIN